jgi:Cu/Ag efflux protein CusF
MRLTHVIGASAAIGFICTAALAQQVLTGTVAKLDEQKGTITIQQTQSGTVGGSGPTEEFKVQDGLVFNALQPGDKVIFTFFQANGPKTITKLNKE